MPTTEVKCGQWWADNDPRTIARGVYQRVGQVIEFREHSAKGTQVLMQWRQPPADFRSPPNRSRTWVSVKRFRKTSSGYMYLGSSPPPADIGPTSIKRTSDQVANSNLILACQNLDDAFNSNDQWRREAARGVVVSQMAKLLEEFGLLNEATMLLRKCPEFDGRHIEEDKRLWKCQKCGKMVEELHRHDGKLVCQQCVGVDWFRSGRDG